MILGPCVSVIPGSFWSQVQGRIRGFCLNPDPVFLWPKWVYNDYGGPVPIFPMESSTGEPSDVSWWLFFGRIIALCHENPRAPNGATLGDSRTYLRPPGRAIVTRKRVCKYKMMCSGHGRGASAVEVPASTPSWHSQRRARGENTCCEGPLGGIRAPEAARMLVRAAAGWRRACSVLGAVDRAVGADKKWARWSWWWWWW
jgi:hypothetical protein